MAPWAPVVVIPSVMIGSVVLGVWLGTIGDRQLDPICDRVVERLLTTRDPVELERSRILVNQLDCSVSDRITKWTAERTGGFNHDAPSSSR